MDHTDQVQGGDHQEEEQEQSLIYQISFPIHLFKAFTAHRHIQLRERTHRKGEIGVSFPRVITLHLPLQFLADRLEIRSGASQHTNRETTGDILAIGGGRNQISVTGIGGKELPVRNHQGVRYLLHDTTHPVALEVDHHLSANRRFVAKQLSSRLLREHYRANTCVKIGLREGGTLYEGMIKDLPIPRIRPTKGILPHQVLLRQGNRTVIHRIATYRLRCLQRVETLLQHLRRHQTSIAFTP